MTEDFHALLEKYALENHKTMPAFTIQADSMLPPNMINIRTVDELSILEPCGCGNETPKFLMRNAMVAKVIPLSDGKHTKLRIDTGNGTVDALAFFRSPKELMVKAGETCDMIVTLEINEYMGNRSVNLFIEDVRPHKFEQNRYFNGQNVFEAFTRGEELPADYYRNMLPTRDETAEIYKHIPDSGISSDSLYMKFCPELNYCKFSVAVESLRQLRIVTVSSSDGNIKRVPTTERFDLNSAPILISLREKIN